MDDHKRQELLSQVERPSRTIGKEVPEKLTVQGETVDLNEFVFECKGLETVSERRRDQIEELKRHLQRERLERKHRIERGSISLKEGERLVRSIHGIDRAVNALEDIDSPDIGEQLRRKRLDDARELLTLIDQARG